MEVASLGIFFLRDGLLRREGDGVNIGHDIAMEVAAYKVLFLRDGLLRGEVGFNVSDGQRGFEYSGELC